MIISHFSPKKAYLYIDNELILTSGPNFHFFAIPTIEDYMPYLISHNLLPKDYKSITICYDDIPVCGKVRG